MRLVKGAVGHVTIPTGSEIMEFGGLFGAVEAPEIYMEKAGGTVHVGAEYMYGGGGLLGIAESPVVELVDGYGEFITIGNAAATVEGVAAVTNVEDWDGGGSITFSQVWGVLELPDGLEDWGSYPPNFVVKTSGEYTNESYTDVYVGSEGHPYVNGGDNHPSWKYYPRTKLKLQNTFQGFDFETMWMIEETVDYPRLTVGMAPPDKIEAYFVTAEQGINEMVMYAGLKAELKIDAIFGEERVDIRDKAVLKDADEDTNENVMFELFRENEKLTFVSLWWGMLNLDITYRGYTENTTVEMIPPSEIEIRTPKKMALSIGSKKRLKAIALYPTEVEEEYFEYNVSTRSKWESDEPEIISVDDKGLIEALDVGSATISATFMDFTGDLLVEPAGAEAPEVVDVNATSATLYVYFTVAQSNAEMDFKLKVGTDDTYATVIDEVTLKENPENFFVSIDEGKSWQALTDAGIKPSGEEMFCASLFVGPRMEVSFMLSAAGEATGEDHDDSEDVYPPILSVLPPPGRYNDESLAIAIKADEPCNIYYTLDGSEPDEYSTLYANPIVLNDHAELKVFAIDMEGNPTGISSYKYVFDRVPPNIYPSLEPGTYYMDPISVYFTVDEAATVYYTTDGTDPDYDSSVYEDSTVLEVPFLSELTFKAFAVDLAGNVSGIVEYVYKVEDMPLGLSPEYPFPIEVPFDGVINVPGVEKFWVSFTGVAEGDPVYVYSPENPLGALRPSIVAYNGISEEKDVSYGKAVWSDLIGFAYADGDRISISDSEGNGAAWTERRLIVSNEIVVTPSAIKTPIPGTISGAYNAERFFIDAKNPSAYVAYTLEKGVNYEFATHGDFDTRIYLYNAAGTQLKTDDDGGYNYLSLIAYKPSTTGVYILRVGFYSNTSTLNQIAVESYGW